MPAGITAATASSISFSSTMVLRLDSFILKWQVTIACRPQSPVHIKQFNFSCNVMTFLCFLGALPASLVAFLLGPVGLFKVYGIALTRTIGENYERSIFTVICNILEKQTAHVEMINIMGILSGYSQHLGSPQEQQEVFTKLLQYYSMYYN